jgi:hypothetical protein
MNDLGRQIAAEAKRQRKAARLGHVSTQSPDEVVAARLAAEADARRRQWDEAQEIERKRRLRSRMVDATHPMRALAVVGALSCGVPSAPLAPQPPPGKFSR